jgi:hypothetical protein
MNTNYYTWKNICSWRNIHTNMEFIRAYVKDLYILSHTIHMQYFSHSDIQDL